MLRLLNHPGCCLALIGGLGLAGRAVADPYADYVKHSVDFRAVKQDKAWAYQAFPSWTFMPWTYQWTIGYTEASGRWSLAQGYNGAFVDHGDVAANGSSNGRLDWINQFGLRFYLDHTANKGLLHLWDGDRVQPHLAELHGTGVRPVPLNKTTLIHRTRAIFRQSLIIAPPHALPYWAGRAEGHGMAAKTRMNTRPN